MKWEYNNVSFLWLEAIRSERLSVCLGFCSDACAGILITEEALWWLQWLHWSHIMQLLGQSPAGRRAATEQNFYTWFTFQRQANEKVLSGSSGCWCCLTVRRPWFKSQLGRFSVKFEWSMLVGVFTGAFSVIPQSKDMLLRLSGVSKLPPQSKGECVSVWT